MTPNTTPTTTPRPTTTATTANSTRPRAVVWITILMLLTITRFSVVFRLPSLEMFDGTSPDAWFAPWVSDTILGLLVPVMAYLAWNRRGVVVWGALIGYNAVGAFDYVHGLATQWIHPLDNAAVTYGSISFFLALQLTVIALLFRPDVITHLTSRPDAG